MLGGLSLKWTVLDQSERSCMKLNGPKGLKVDDLRNWTVLKSKNGPQGLKLDILRDPL